MSESLTLSPATEPFPDSRPAQHPRARLRLPFTGRSIRVRSLALGVSVALHAVFLGGLLLTRLTAPLPVLQPLVEVEFVEIAGAKGGGGSPVQAAPASTVHAAAPPSQAALVKDRAAQPQRLPQQVPAASAASASALSAASSSGGTNVGSGGGTGGGTGGGQGTGSGQSVGSGTGQGGVAVDRMPVAVKRVKPVYPMDARRRGISGQVTLRLYVDAEGGVREVQVQAADPAGIFEEKAVEAARKWKFEPAVFKGAPVGVWMTLPVRFVLDGRE
jgi:protein TonB